MVNLYITLWLTCEPCTKYEYTLVHSLFDGVFIRKNGVKASL